ncbi:MAG: C10 family peptidase [Muribaculaceae bacterium]|nr:C10 family peptidase [Muribaculaceae bacterium]
MKNLLSSMMLASLAMATLTASAGNIDANAARIAAGNFIHNQAAKGTFRAPATADLRLIHTEASSTVAGANDYYAFNLKGGGFIIIAGEDRAPQVLGYSDKGQLDFNRLPYGLQGLLNGFKAEIEYLQTYEGDDLVPAPQSFKATTGVDPLIKTNWGQEAPYDWQCPVYNNQYCVVGCVATAMAQVMKYWQYPESCSGVSSYYCSSIRKTVQALPATTFDYSLMIPSYCHWDWDNSQLVQDTYTDAQAQEVAKLGRYCGQAVEMGYSPEGSGAYTSDQLAAMKAFGYRSSAQYVQKSGWYSSSYTTAQWEAMMKTELDAGRPILYAANDVAGGGGHAFICDGYNAEGKFHYNFGWYGTCDGWYVSTALNMTHREGDYLRFNSGHEMLIGIQPPEGWQPPVTVLIGDVNMDGNVNIDDVTALIDYLLSQNATGVDLAAADVDGSGNISIDDVTALIDKLLSGE